MTTKYIFVSAGRGNHTVTTLWRVVGVSLSGFYAWLRAIPTLQHRVEADAELRAPISAVSSPPSAGPMAHRVCMPSCAGKGGGTRDGAASG